MLFSRLIKINSTQRCQRETVMNISGKHHVSGHNMLPPFPQGVEQIVLGMGCFWGAERKFWNLPGIYVTAVGYSAGHTINPSYEEVCTGLTGHNEVVLVAYDTSKITLNDVLVVFWESHNPTQGMRQGNDIGSQYRSGIYTYSSTQLELANASLQSYQQAISAQGFDSITTEVLPIATFYYAEEYHQQYLAKNPSGYCGLGGIGIAYP